MSNSEVKKEMKIFFAVGLATKQNGINPGLYAGLDKKTGSHVFLEKDLEDSKRNLKVDLLEDEKAAEKKLEAVQQLLHNFDLSIKKIEIEVVPEEKVTN